MRSSNAACGLALALLFTIAPAQADDLIDALKQFDVNVLPTDDASRKEHQRMLPDLASRMLREANTASTKAWPAASICTWPSSLLLVSTVSSRLMAVR